MWSMSKSGRLRGTDSSLEILENSCNRSTPVSASVILTRDIRDHEDPNARSVTGFLQGLVRSATKALSRHDVWAMRGGVRPDGAGRNPMGEKIVRRKIGSFMQGLQPDSPHSRLRDTEP